MARSNKRYREICEGMWYVLENKEQDRGTSREVEIEWSTREIMDISNGRFHHKVAVSSRKEYNLSSI